MEGDQIVVVHLVDVIGRQDHGVVRLVPPDEVPVALNGIGRAAVALHRVVRALDRLQQPHAAVHAVQVPRAARADVLVERVRAILREDAHGGNAGVRAVGEREVDDAVLPGEGHGGLGALLREDAEPAASSAGEDHGECVHGSSLWGGCGAHESTHADEPSGVSTRMSCSSRTEITCRVLMQLDRPAIQFHVLLRRGLPRKIGGHAAPLHGLPAIGIRVGRQGPIERADQRRRPYTP